MSRKLMITAGVAVLMLIGVAAIYLWPVPKDPLCQYVNESRLECLAMVADRQTYRPGALARVYTDAKDKDLRRVELPAAYLDNETCVIPGATLAGLSPQPQPFNLRSITYSSKNTSNVGGKLAQGLEINIGPQSERIQSVDLSFGNARTSLLDETVLVDRINSCKIRPRCVQQIQDQGYNLVNRVLEVDEIAYAFKDSKGASLSIDTLLKENAIKLGGSFVIGSASGESLKSKHPAVIAVSFVNSSVVLGAQPCEAKVVFSPEGNSQVAIGGGGRPGHIAENIAPAVASLGAPAELRATGSENQMGNMERRQSMATARALVRKGSADNEIKLNLNVRASGGHYGVRGRFGIGIISGHDTGANASAQVDGRINVLLRQPSGRLKVAWSGFPATGADGAVSNIAVVAPTGRVIQQILVTAPQGEQTVELPAEGQYAVHTRASLRAERSGSSEANQNVDARVSASIE